jgi:hypothetical protein
MLDERAEVAEGFSFDAQALVAISDADMAGTGYADGRLLPLAGAQDVLSVILPDDLGRPVATAPVSNSVMAWPGSLDVSPDGRFAYVVETRGPPPAGVTAFEAGVFDGMPVGRVLSVIDLGDVAAPRLATELDVGEGPNSVHVSPDGSFALVSLRSYENPIAAVLLQGGLPTDVRPIALPLSVRAQREIDYGALFVRLAPNGRDFAINVANTHIQFGRLRFDPDGAPIGAELVGAAFPAGQWLTVLRWSRDGRHLIVADVDWGPSQLGAVLNGPGQMISIAFQPGGDHRIASSVRVSLSPEGFDFNRAGDLLAVVNMERAYLPERLPFTLFGRRDRWSLSLVSFDAATGRLAMVDGPLAFEGMLPEDAVFDRDGDAVAVAVFHERGDAPRTGWIEYVRVERDGAGPRLAPTGIRTPTVRGAHDLVLIP